jgi:hypothetical protein
MPLWAWVIAGVLVLVGLFRVAQASFRRDVQDQFLVYLRTHHPEWSASASGRDAIVVRLEVIGESTMHLDRLFREIMAAHVKTFDERSPVFQRFAETLAQHARDATPSLDRDGERILPRLVPADSLATLSEQVCHTAHPQTGLLVVYVLDSPSSVTYVNEDMRTALGLSLAELHARALENLRPRFPDAVVRDVLATGQMAAVKTQDTYDAARALLIPQLLGADEKVVVAIPDRDTLVILPYPVDSDLTAIRELARVTSGPALLGRPLVVTRQGFQLG